MLLLELQFCFDFQLLISNHLKDFFKLKCVKEHVQYKKCFSETQSEKYV